MIPLGPRTRTVSLPGPAPRVSTNKSLSKHTSSPDCRPGPVTRTLLASVAEVTLMLNGVPSTNQRRFVYFIDPGREQGNKNIQQFASVD